LSGIFLLCYNIAMTTKPATLLEIEPAPSFPRVMPQGHDHAHGHDHDHDHDHGHGHEHGHGHAPAPFRPPFSLVRLSVGGRLAIALALSAGVWLAVRWALMPIG